MPRRDGLGLAGSLGPALWTPLTLAIFAAQAAFSAAWLARFRYGPLEWAWRRLTYLRPLPGRRSASVSAGASRP